MSTWFYYNENGEKINVTGGQLKWLAKNGKIVPETMVESEEGKTIPAAKIKGLTFVETTPPETTAPSATAKSTDNPFSVTMPNTSRVARASAQVAENEEPKNSSNSSLISTVITALPFVLALIGICALVLYWIIPPSPASTSLYGAVRITGTLTLDGKPIEGASIIMHPRNGKEDHVARGITNSQGTFRVTTGADPLGSGAVPGEYDVTFRKRDVIPSKYETIETSGLTPIRVESNGENRFVFELQMDR